MDQNQRLATRRYLHRYPHVTRPNSEDIIGYLGDISSQGMMLITYEVLALHSQQLFCIHLPEHKAFSQSQFDVDIEVRWVKAYHEQEDLHCMGCRFSQLDKMDLVLIDAIQTQLGFEPGFNPERFGSK